MKLTVRRMSRNETGLLDAALKARPHMPFARGYKLPPEGSRRWACRVFADAADGRGGALVAESDGAVAGGLALSEIEWEASIFGVPMARIPFLFTVSDDLDRSRRVAAALLRAASEAMEDVGTKHCSALVQAEDTGIIHAFCDAGWRLVDSTVDFTWVCGRTNPGDVDPSVNLRSAVKSDREPLARLAREAYTRSIRTRFSTDPWLPVEKTGELYARWFELACDGEFADVVVVAEVAGRPVGFNTFKLNRTLTECTGVGFAAHGIAAVDPEFRGRAGQPAMLHWLTEWQRERGGAFNQGRVLTNNYPMQRACLKSGAYVSQAYHTFHTWRGEPPAPGDA